MGRKPVSSNRQLAETLGISHTLVNRKLKQGKSVEQIATEAGRPASSAKSESFADAQARKEKALADLRELEYQQKSGELVDRGETAEAWAGMISEAKAALLNIGDELGDVLAAEASPIRCRELVNEKVRDALMALAHA